MNAAYNAWSLFGLAVFAVIGVVGLAVGSNVDTTELSRREIERPAEYRARISHMSASVSAGPTLQSVVTTQTSRFDLPEEVVVAVTYNGARSTDRARIDLGERSCRSLALTDGSGRVSCRFRVERAGTYYARARINGRTVGTMTLELISIDHFDRGVERYRLGDYAGAMEDFARVLQSNPNNAAAAFNRGLSRYNLRDFPGAITDYSQALDREPRNVAYLTSRGRAYFELAQNDRARADFDAALAADQAYVAAYISRGRLSAAMGNYVDAITDYDSALKFDPTNAQAQHLRPEAVLALDRLRAPITSDPVASRITQVAPTEPTFLSNPPWIEQPNQRDFERHFPRRARSGGGRVTLECNVERSGRLGCRVISEEPQGQGFGQAALALSNEFRVASATADGTPTEGRVVRLPLRFAPSN